VNEREFHQSLIGAHAFFKDLGIARPMVAPRSLPVNPSFNKFALDTELPYGDVYFAGLRLGQFNFQLSDFSYFQFSFATSDDVRYAFYPAPFGAKAQARLDLLHQLLLRGDIDEEAYHTFAEEVPLNYGRPLLRYEYNVGQYKLGLHPASHLHIGTFGDDRWAFQRQLTPRAFALIIGKLYFRPHWEAVTVNGEDDSRENEFDRILLEERRQCVITPQHMFSEEEHAFFFS